MLVTLLRVLFGFLIACLGAGAVKVGFVMTPFELAALPESQLAGRLGEAGMLTLAAATQSAVFAAPFALVAAAIAEWQSLRGLLYYVIVGLAISAGGFAAIYAGEPAGPATIVNSYAASAYAVAGLVGGFIYWLLAGRFAGEVIEEDDYPAMPAEPQQKLNRPAAATPPRPTPAAPPPSSTPAVPPRKA